MRKRGGGEPRDEAKPPVRIDTSDRLFACLRSVEVGITSSGCSPQVVAGSTPLALRLRAKANWSATRDEGGIAQEITLPKRRGSCSRRWATAACAFDPEWAVADAPV